MFWSVLRSSAAAACRYRRCPGRRLPKREARNRISLSFFKANVCTREICFTSEFMAWKTEREKYLQQQQKKTKIADGIHTIKLFSIVFSNFFSYSSTCSAVFSVAGASRRRAIPTNGLSVAPGGNVRPWSALARTETRTDRTSGD